MAGVMPRMQDAPLDDERTEVVVAPKSQEQDVSHQGFCLVRSLVLVHSRTIIEAAGERAPMTSFEEGA